MPQAAEFPTTLSRRAVIGAALLPVAGAGAGAGDPAGASPALASTWRALWQAANAAPDDEDRTDGMTRLLTVHEARIAAARPHSRAEALDLLDALSAMLEPEEDSLPRFERVLLSGIRSARDWLGGPYG